jgi:hypothetical protein
LSSTGNKRALPQPEKKKCKKKKKRRSSESAATASFSSAAAASSPAVGVGFATGMSAGQAMAVQQLNAGTIQFQQSIINSLVSQLGTTEGAEQKNIADLTRLMLSTHSQMHAASVDVTAASAAGGGKK